MIDLRDKKLPNNQVHITLTKDHGALIWNYGSHNKLPWWDQYDPTHSICGMGRKECDTSVQKDWMSIRFTPKGILINMSREGPTWNGDVNRYSLDVKPTVERLLDLKIVTPRTPIYVGNWARRQEEGELIGSVAKILGAAPTPNKLILYHGTSNVRAKIILAEGLQPLDIAERVWKGSKTAPAHRAQSVYLTASMAQAEYYSRKATNVDRKRTTYEYERNLRSKIVRELEWIGIYQRGLENSPDPNSYSTKQRIKDLAIAQANLAKLKRAQDLVKKMRSANTDKITPVVLEITITRADYKKLRADDDFLAKMNAKGIPTDPMDWRESLSDFGQVAFTSSIGPEHIKVLD